MTAETWQVKHTINTRADSYLKKKNYFFFLSHKLLVHLGEKKKICNSCSVKRGSQLDCRKNHLSHLPDSFTCKAAAGLLAVCLTLRVVSSYLFVSLALKFTLCI